MDRMLESGEVAHGGLALLIGFGAGLAYAAQVVDAALVHRCPRHRQHDPHDRTHRTDQHAPHRPAPTRKEKHT